MYCVCYACDVSIVCAMCLSHMCRVLFCVCASCVLRGHVWEVGECWAGSLIVGVCVVCMSGSERGSSICGQSNRLLGRTL